MKKFYSTLGMMLSFGLAIAGTSPYQGKKVELHNNVSQLDQKVALKPAAKMMKKDGLSKLPSSVEEFCGNYVWVDLDPLDDGDYIQGDMLFVPTGNGNEVYAYGINTITETPVKAVFDPDEMTISFPNRQALGQMEYTEDGYNVVTTVLTFMHVSIDGAGYFYEDNTPIVGYISEYGIDFEFFDVFALTPSGPFNGIFEGHLGNLLYSRDNVLSNDGWTDAGYATISNPWFQYMPGIFGKVSTEPYKVAYQVSKSIPGYYRLVNPFGAGTPYEDFNLAIAEGAVYFQILDVDPTSDPYGENPTVYDNLVCVHRAYDQILGYDQETNQPIYCTWGNWAGMFYGDMTNFAPRGWYPGNEAGYNYFELGFAPEDIIDDAFYFGTEIPTYKDGIVTIPDPVFSLSFDITGLYNGWDETLETITIVLDNSGVKGINSDDANAPVRYYNLQGVEIANPIKGQLVI